MTKENRNHERFSVRERWQRIPSTLRNFILYAVSVGIWIALWYIASVRIHENYLLPQPETVIARLFTMSLTAEFWRVILTTLVRITIGMCIGISMGSALALLTHFLPHMYTFFSPLMTVIRSTPVASFIILVYLWIGRDALPGFICFLLVLPVVWANLHEALSAIDKNILEMARVFRLSLWKQIIRIYVPSVMPSLVASTRTSVGLSWKAGIAAEVLVLPAISVGRHLSDAKLYMETVDLFAWTLAVVLMSLLIELITVAILSAYGKRAKNVKERRHYA